MAILNSYVNLPEGNKNKHNSSNDKNNDDDHNDNSTCMNNY